MTFDVKTHHVRFCTTGDLLLLDIDITSYTSGGETIEPENLAQYGYRCDRIDYLEIGGNNTRYPIEWDHVEKKLIVHKIGENGGKYLTLPAGTAVGRVLVYIEGSRY